MTKYADQVREGALRFLSNGWWRDQYEVAAHLQERVNDVAKVLRAMMNRGELEIKVEPPFGMTRTKDSQVWYRIPKK